MTTRIDSGALVDITRSLGVSGRGESVSVLQDGEVFQVLSINQLARRGRTLAGSQGFFSPVMRHVHAAAGQIQSSVNPYNVGVGTIAPWTSPISDDFDVWLIGATIRTHTGGLTFDSAALALDFQGGNQGWGQDDSGVAVVSSAAKPVALWDSTFSVVGFQVMGLQENGAPYAAIGIRIPRGPGGAATILTFATDTSGGPDTLSIDLQLFMGLFPTSLGQDIS